MKGIQVQRTLFFLTAIWAQFCLAQNVLDLHGIVVKEEAVLRRGLIVDGLSNAANKQMSIAMKGIHSTIEALLGLEEIITTSIADECRAGTHNCGQGAMCHNDIIGFSCSCLPGYFSDGFSCQDIDECKTGKNECHAQAFCNNTAGSYTCECPRPFVGNGFSCMKPMCAPPSNEIEGLGCVMPVNERMYWTDAKKHCESRGMRMLEGITSKNQIESLKFYFEDSLCYKVDSQHDVWLGFFQGKWVDGGQEVDAHLWQSDQPTGGEEECGYIAFQHSALFDTKCYDYKFPSICQMKIP